MSHSAIIRLLNTQKVPKLWFFMAEMGHVDKQMTIPQVSFEMEFWKKGFGLAVKMLLGTTVSHVRVPRFKFQLDFQF